MFIVKTEHKCKYCNYKARMASIVGSHTKAHHYNKWYYENVTKPRREASKKRQLELKNENA